MSPEQALEHIRKDVAQLSISEDSKTRASKEKTKKPRRYILQRWVYGYRMKNTFVKEMSERYDLPWQDDIVWTFSRLEGHVQAVSGVDYRVDTMHYRGRTIFVFHFVEDDHRKRLHHLEVSKEDMDKVRAALGLPEGIEPRWYELNGMYPEGTTYDSEDDIEWDDNEPPHEESPLEKFARRCVVINLDEEDDSDSDEMEED